MKKDFLEKVKLQMRAQRKQRLTRGGKEGITFKGEIRTCTKPFDSIGNYDQRL